VAFERITSRFRRSEGRRPIHAAFSQATVTNLIAVALIVIAAVASVLFDGLKYTAEGVGLLVVCLVVASAVAAFVTTSLTRGRLREWIGPLVDQERLTKLTEQFLLPDDYLCSLEQAIDVPEIWVVTEVPGYDSTGIFRQVIEENITTRRIRYLYVVPDSVGQSVINAVVRDLPGPSFRVIKVPDAAWSSRPISVRTIIIYNPNSVSKFAECLAYFEYPETEPTLWGRVGTNTATLWADQVRKMAPDVDLQFDAN
jgi:hypothetical protein